MVWPLRLTVLGCAASLVLLVVPVASAATSERGPSIGGPITVGYSSEAALEAAVARAGSRVLRRLPNIRVAVVSGSGRSAELLAGSSGISFLERSVRRTRSAEPGLAPAGALGAFEWQYAATHADTVPESVLRAASAITIAVIDTGADLSAPDLAAKSPFAFDIRTRADDGSREGSYAFGTGTSYATPQVAGAAALVWAANPGLSAADVADYLKGTASGQGRWSPRLGYGVLDVGAAVALALASR